MTQGHCVTLHNWYISYFLITHVKIWHQPASISLCGSFLPLPRTRPYIRPSQLHTRLDWLSLLTERTAPHNSCVTGRITRLPESIIVLALIVLLWSEMRRHLDTDNSMAVSFCVYGMLQLA